MELTPEQLERLVEGFQTHDFTQEVHLPSGAEKEPDRKYTPLEKRVLSYMKNNLPNLGFTRNMASFSNKHPVNVLMSADARYISNEAMQILEDEEKTRAALEQFTEMFSPLLEFTADAYCQSAGKTSDELNDDDIQLIFDHVTSVVNTELINVLMQGQQFPALNNIAHKHLTHEDFSSKITPDSINFYKQWTKQWAKSDTPVKEMLSLDDEKLDLHTSIQADFITHTLFDDFCATLDDTNKTILRMRMDKFTYKEIAEKLGYKNHSAVLKRMKKITKLWTEFTGESDQ